MENVNHTNTYDLFDSYLATLEKFIEEKSSSLLNNQCLVFKLKKNEYNEIVLVDFTNSIDGFYLDKSNVSGRKLIDVFGANIDKNFIAQIEIAFKGNIVQFNAIINDINLFVTLVPVFFNNELIEVVGTSLSTSKIKNELKDIVNNVKQFINSFKLTLEIYNKPKSSELINPKGINTLNSMILVDNDLLNKVLSFAKIGLWRVELNSMNIIVSNQVFEILGINNEAKGNDLSKWMDLIHIDDMNKVNNNYKMFLEKKLKIFESTFRVKKQDNDWVWVKCIGQSYYTDPNNNFPTTIVGLVIDIHSEKTNDLEKDRLISELKKSNFAAEETAIEIIELYQELVNSEKFFVDMNLRKDELFSILSVELKSSILGFLSLSNLIFQEYHNFSKEEIKDALKEIHISSKNLFDFLENILLWTQIQNKKIEYNPNFFYLKDLLNESLLLFANIIQNKNLIIENIVDEKIVVFVDYNMINSLFRNLISNSIKFSNQKSKIIIKNKPIELNSSFIEISINDNGIGIDDKYKKYIFKFNKKAIRRGSNNEIGSGLGLVLCKEFINYHKGKIWFESNRATGTTFYFTLPLVRL